MDWFIDTAHAAVGGVQKSVNVCKSFFNFLGLPCSDEGGTDTTSSVYGLIVRAVRFLLEISASVALALLVYAGYLYISAAADPDQAKKAKDIFMWSLIGLVIIMAAFLITSAVKAIVYGINFS